MNFTRREFIGLAGNAAVIVGIGGLIRFFGSANPPLRPPGAVTEQDFLAVCLRCERCSEVCPTEVIVQEVIGENLLGFGTPQLAFRMGYCTFCLKCVQSCPTGALAVAPGEQVVLGVAQINTTNCIAWTWGGCTKCQQVCPKGAITLDQAERPVVDPAPCNGCGRCEYECPSSSLRSGSGAGGQGIKVVPLGRERARAAVRGAYSPSRRHRI